MKKIYLILALLFLIPSSTIACLWVNGTTIDGDNLSASGPSSISRLRHAMKNTPENKLRSFTRKIQEDESSEIGIKEIDAIELILTDKYQIGIASLSEIEKSHPGRYSTAANLGTAFELNGDIFNALVWIKEAINRNPDSHHGTEWLHQLILETQIKIEKDPNYLMGKRIIELPDNFINKSKINISESTYSVSEIKNALEHQLSERMIFVKPPNPIVADLLFTLARIEAQTWIVEPALELLELSSEYGFDDQKLISKKRDKYKASILKKQRNKSIKLFLIIIGTFCVLSYFYKKKWFFLSHAAYKKHKNNKI